MRHLRYLTPLVALVVLLGWSGAVEQAMAGPNIVEYQFPASWDGTSATVLDLSPAGNNGMPTGGAALSANVPAGAPVGAMSLNSIGEGGILTDNINLLENLTLEMSQGFVFSASIYWDGGEGNRTVQKIIDNEGTDSLQLANIDTVNGTADLQMTLNDASVVSTPIAANTWYDVTATFDTQGNAIDLNGDLAGMVTLTANGTSVSAAALRTVGGVGSSDQYDRPIAIGVLGLPAVPTLVNFSGDIYNPTVSLLVPEPSSAILLMGAACVLGLRRRR